MNLLRDAPLWAQLLVMLLLVAAAAQDVVERRISNWLCAAVLIAAAAAAMAVGPGVALWQNALLVAAVVVLGLPLFAAGWLGGGDVKLLAAVASWADLASILPLLALIFIAGGAVALLSLAVRRKALSKAAKGVPYGVAIALGTGIVIAQPLLVQQDRKRADPLDLAAAAADPSD